MEEDGTYDELTAPQEYELPDEDRTALELIAPQE